MILILREVIPNKLIFDLKSFWDNADG